jgi:hypothetical protein
MADIAFWLGLTAVCLVFLIGIGTKPLAAQARSGARILGYPDNVNPRIMTVLLRVAANMGVLLCATGAVGAILRRFG